MATLDEIKAQLGKVETMAGGTSEYTLINCITLRPMTKSETNHLVMFLNETLGKPAKVRTLQRDKKVIRLSVENYDPKKLRSLIIEIKVLNENKSGPQTAHQ